jgi:hypothetical protein
VRTSAPFFIYGDQYDENLFAPEMYNMSYPESVGTRAIVYLPPSSKIRVKATGYFEIRISQKLRLPDIPEVDGH